jgi:hypothetical protein
LLALGERDRQPPVNAATSENTEFTAFAACYAHVFVQCVSCWPVENFAAAGSRVANLTVPMRTVSLLVLLAFPLEAQNWSASIGSGPFIFGHFAERTVTIGTEASRVTTRSRLSAATRAGAAADIERDFGRWFGVRLEAASARSPLSVKSKSDSSSVSFDAGHINVTTFVLPVVLHFNRGSFRIHALAGPAYGLYNVHRRAGSGVSEPLFEGTRGRWGASAGVGASWWWSSRVGVEWQAADIVTQSPFHVSDVAATSKGVRILRPHNGHTTVGIRYRF